MVARDQLYPLVEAELRKLARAFLHGQAGHETIQSTLLVDEAFLRLVNDSKRQWEGRHQFFQLANGVMRRVLADHSRRRRPPRLPADAAPRLVDTKTPPPEKRLEDEEEMQTLAEAIERLEGTDPQAADMFFLCFFNGLDPAARKKDPAWLTNYDGDRRSVDEVAKSQSRSRATAYRVLGRAIAFLQQAVQGT